MSGKGVLVFVVDDDLFIRELVRKSLTAKGYSVETFSYGEECLEALEKKLPALIILDYLFEKSGGEVMNGKEIFYKIREKFPNLPVIMLSGQDSGGVVLELARLGINDYIIKDQSLGENLIQAIEDIVGSEQE